MSEENNEEYTVGEFEEMDLSAIKDKLFMVAISSGPRDKPKFICETICGPLDFYEMVEVVGNLYEEQLLHAKVMIPSKQFGKAPMILNENTVDFIEARYMDIIADGLLDGAINEMKEYTCTAGFLKEEIKEEVDAEQDTSP